MVAVPDYLLVRGKSPENAVDALAVAADMDAVSEEVQVDIATTGNLVDYLEVGGAVRRVVGIDAPDIEEIKGLNFSETDGGWGKKLFSAAKSLTKMAGENARNYWGMAETLRLVRYDAVFDLDASAFSLAVARLAKADRIVGFDVSGLSNPAPGAAMMYHETYLIAKELSREMRARRLVARHLDYAIGGRRNHLRETPPLSVAPSEDFVLLCGQVPRPFREAVEAREIVVISEADGPYDALSGLERVALARQAKAAVGDGGGLGLAAVAGAAALFIGALSEKPENAVAVTTPTELNGALESLLSPPPPEPSPAAEVSSPIRLNKGGANS